MGRPREFEEHDVLDQALDVFWQRGYAGTSVRDLTAATGVAASALYRTWGDKHNLFLRVLDRYATNQAATFGEHVARSGAVPDLLRGWLMSRVEEARADRDGRGCLMVNTAAELGTNDRLAAERARAAWKVLRDGLEQTIRRGQETGEVAASVDPGAVSELLLTTVLGLRVRGRAGEPRHVLEQAVNAAVGTLNPKRTRPHR